MTKQSTTRTVVSSVLGSALEFYDFTLCGVFIPVLSAVFFPKHIENVAFLGGIFAFSAAFWTRPLGAILFGYLGDKYGRKNVLSATIFLMGVPTVVIGLLPGYEQIGMAAPIILLMVRMLQGLCAGGEYNGAAIFSLEHSKRKPGLTSGLIASSCVLGVVVGVSWAILLLRFRLNGGIGGIHLLLGGSLAW
jgi:MHS family proline/betaine transporter-like MFS transporter